MISDNEIGELWRKHKLPVVGQLIRKLVEERANYLQQVLETSKDCLDYALRDFGIKDFEP